MIRRIAFLLALALVLCGVPALAMTGDGLLLEVGRRESESMYCFTDGDALYVSSDDGLYTWRMGDEAPAFFSYELPELDEDEKGSAYAVYGNGGLYAIRLIWEVGEDETEFDEARLYSLSLEGGAAVGEEVCDLDWDELVEYDDNDMAVPSKPVQSVAIGGRVYMLCEGQDRYSLDYVTACLDIEEETVEAVDDLEDACALSAYKDGTLLAQLYQPYASEATLAVYDPEEEALEELATLPTVDYSPLVGLAYDAETDTPLLVRDGEIVSVSLPDGEVGSGIAPLSTAAMFASGSACVMNGGIYVLCLEGVQTRALHDRPEVRVRLRVNDYIYSEPIAEAVKRFNDTHDDVRMLLTRDSEVSKTIVESMMNQDSSVDIYVLDPTTPAYDALYRRGFMLPLDDCKNLSALVSQMYPKYRESLTFEGHVIALPTMVDAPQLGINVKALEKLGLSYEDIPDTWCGFLDYLPTLAEMLADHRELRLFDSLLGESETEARMYLAVYVLDDYLRYTSNYAPDMPFNTDMLREPLEKLSALDMEALGMGGNEDDVEQTALIDFFSSSCIIGGMDLPDHLPLLLRLNEDEPPFLCYTDYRAVVNPYTQYPEYALEFMELLSESLSPAMRATLVPTLNEPIRGAANERLIQEQKEKVENLEKQLEKASETGRPLIEDQLEEAREELEDTELKSWDVPPADLEWLRAHDDNIVPTGVNWLNSDLAVENYEAIFGYMEGNVSAEDMLSQLDQATQMMRMEGN